MLQLIKTRSTLLKPQIGQSIKLSETWFAKLGVRVFGAQRVAGWYQSGRLLKARAGAAINRKQRHALERRAELIALLSAPTQQKCAVGTSSSTNEMILATPTARHRQHGEFKIAVFIPNFLIGKGGAEKVAGQVAATLAKAGNAVHLYCRSPGLDAPAINLKGGFQIKYLFERDEKKVQALKRENYDLLIGFAMRGFYLRIAAISLLLDVPFVIQECNNPDYIALNLLDAHLCRDDKETFWLRQAVCAHAAGVRLTVPHYASSVGRDMQPFTYAFFNAFKMPVPTSKHPKRKFICVGALKNENKNGLAAAKAFCRFASEHPGWSLHFYGENRNSGALMKIQNEFPNVSIIDHGVVDNIDEIYSDAYALIIPSYHEGLPSVVIEAFYYGVPCIGFSDCEGSNLLIQHGRTGLLLDRSVPNALSDALKFVAKSEVRERLSADATRFAQLNLRLEGWEAEWLRIVQNAANGLNNCEKPQRPVAHEELGSRALLWRELLETYLHFAHYPEGRRVRFANGAAKPICAS